MSYTPPHLCAPHALQISTPANIGTASTTLFALGNPREYGSGMSTRAMVHLEETLHGVQFIIIDEYSVMGLVHWAGICNHVQRARRTLAGADAASLPHRPLADLHVALFGDPRQHTGPKQTPVYTGARLADTDAAARVLADRLMTHGKVSAVTAAKAAAGRKHMRSLDAVFYLQQQHRRDDTQTGAQALNSIARIFDGGGHASPAEIERAVQQLNDRAIRSLDGLFAPRTVLLRHSVQVYVNRRLAMVHAQQLHRPVYVWRSHDQLDAGGAVSAEVATKLGNMPFNHTGNINTFGFFFQGMLTTFTDSDAPALHRITTNTATAVSLVPHDRETPLPTTPGVHVLRYMPKAMIVLPDGPPLGSVCGAPVPDNCIMLVPETATFTVSGMPHKITRLGFKGGAAYAPTDYAAQGQSFRATDWLAHICPPDHGPFQRASLYVVLTRFSDMAGLHLLAPLYAPNNMASYQAAIDHFTKVARRDEDLAAEMDRLRAAATATAAAMPAAIARAKAAAAPLPPQPF
jgi:hypothetical protein